MALQHRSFSDSNGPLAGNRSSFLVLSTRLGLVIFFGLGACRVQFTRVSKIPRQLRLIDLVFFFILLTGESERGPNSMCARDTGATSDAQGGESHTNTKLPSLSSKTLEVETRGNAFIALVVVSVLCRRHENPRGGYITVQITCASTR